MTKEEIEKLPGIVDTILDESVTAHVSEKMHEKITEVCNLAIEALSAEPCEDAISRAWIKEAIHNLYHYSRHTPTEEDIQEYIVDDAPPVTPKQKIGFDGKTNGEVIQALFPNIGFHDMAFTVHAVTNVTSNGVKGSISYDFWKEWWNAPYKAESDD